MLKAAASCVLASRKTSTCKSTPQPCAPLRSCWTATLNILVGKRLYRKGLKSISLDTAERAYAISSSKCFER
jgi:hypothetical protein